MHTKQSIWPRVIFDVVTNQEIIFERGLFLAKCHNLGINNTHISHLISGRNKSVSDRYILPENKKDIIILMDFDSGEQFPCINVRTLLRYYLKLPYNDNDYESRYFYELRVGRQNFASIGGRLFSTPENHHKYPLAKTIVSNNKISQIRLDAKMRHRMVSRLRGRLGRLVKLGKAVKKTYMLDLLGCDLESFLSHLESQFKDGISWDNYGEWHIDHIKPCAKFDLFDIEEQKKCFHYSNLQPLWASDNCKKHDKYIEGP